MDRYQIADNQDGPWLEMFHYKTPQMALESARASFLWDEVWIAKMQPLKAADILPSPQMIYGDAEEIAAMRFGSSVAEQIADCISPDRNQILTVLNKLVDEHTKLGEIMVAGIKKGYKIGQAVRPNDFDPNKQPKKEPAKQKLDDLL